ncbi:MAG: hypothetical protein WC956_03135 [bacterium]
MISASGGYPQQAGYGGYPQQAGYGGGYGSGYGGTPYYGGMGGASFQPVMMPAYNTGAPSSPNISIESKMESKDLKNYMLGGLGVQVGGMLAGLLNQSWNYNLASQSMTNQKDIAIKYYSTQDSIAGYQKEVAISQLGVQEKAIEAQVSMHKDQVDHEQEMAKLEGNTASRLAYITEQGKTQRAKIYSVTDAFSRRDWDMGMPTLAA